MQEPVNEGLILRYLLGDLAEDEQIQVEDRAFSDPQYMQEVLAVESDLIDEYVRGGLSGRELRQFEKFFLASKERREKVEFARALAKVASESSASEPKRSQSLAFLSSFGDSLGALLSGTSPAFRLSLAAASLLILIGISLLAVQTLKLRGELAQLRAEQRERQHEQEFLEKQIADARANNEDLTARLQREQQQRDQSEQTLRELERESESAAKPVATVLSLALLPGLPRGDSSRPTLALSPSARLVRIQIGIEPGDEYRSFHVDLNTQGGKRVWTQGNLSARASKAGQTLTLTLPARVLDAGQYELSLKGTTGGGTVEDVGYYYFEVRKK